MRIVTDQNNQIVENHNTANIFRNYANSEVREKRNPSIFSDIESFAHSSGKSKKDPFDQIAKKGSAGRKVSITDSKDLGKLAKLSS